VVISPGRAFSPARYLAIAAVFKKGRSLVWSSVGNSSGYLDCEGRKIIRPRGRGPCSGWRRMRGDFMVRIFPASALDGIFHLLLFYL
jgi:hypothetical protein